jgi:HEAT repeat protein
MQPTDALLRELESAPESQNVGDLVAELGRQVDDAVRSNRWERALTIIAALVRLEQRVPEGSARRNYGIALRRMYTKPLLKGLAGLLSAPKHEADAVLALQRGGADAVEVLLEQLITSTAVNERRGIFDALRQANAGREQLIPLLRHEKWYVIRNIAELIGEMGMQSAVPELASCVSHPDERVRKAVALALAKIGTPNTGEPLRRALKDKSPEVRIQVAVGVGGRRTTGLAMPLIVALKDEEDETVQREMILALGRIGTPDAVQALIKVAQPSGFLFGRRSVALRLAAVEALRLAATAPALGTLEGLGGDSDKQVRAAAQAAVWEMTKKKKKN